MTLVAANPPGQSPKCEQHILTLAIFYCVCYNKVTKNKGGRKMDTATTIEELKEMPNGDDWGEEMTIGQLEDWPGEVEDW